MHLFTDFVIPKENHQVFTKIATSAKTVESVRLLDIKSIYKSEL